MYGAFGGEHAIKGEGTNQNSEKIQNKEKFIKN